MNVQITPARMGAMRDLHGKVSLVTGSTSGIGLGIARALAEAGSRIVLNGLGSPAQVAEVRASFAKDFGVPASYSAADMTEPDAISRMIAYGERARPSRHSGQQCRHPTCRAHPEFPTEKWDAILAINLSSAFHCIKAAVPAMRRNGFGRIINIASAHGLVGSPFKAAYVTAKHGIVGLTKVVALETAEEGITCNAVCPGYVYTTLVEAQIEGQAKSHNIPREQVIRDILLAQQPNKRFATTEELGDLAVFLASPAAASINRIALPVDGGWTAH